MPQQKSKVFFYQLVTFVLFSFLSLSSQALEQIKQSPKFLSIADIHFDPFTSCTTQQAPCQVIEKLRAASVNEWQVILDEYAAAQPKYFQDANYLLIKSSFAELKQIAAQENPRFILVLGDLLAHHFKDNFQKYSSDTSQASYEDFVRKTLLFINNQIAQAFPNTDVYSVIGNNDSYDEDYASEPNGSFYRDVGTMWSSLIKDSNVRAQMQQQFPTAGYYAIDIHQQPGLRLIVLNSVLFSNRVNDKKITDAANAELDWLHQELATAASHHQKAIIALHIPPGTDIYTSLKQNPFALIELWHPEFTQRFEDEMRQFSENVVGIFPGHYHMDWFQVFSFNHKIPLSGTPSISPLFGNNPAFKIFTYSDTTFELENFETYYLQLSQQTGWNKEYNFNAVYQPTCEHCKLINGMIAGRLTGTLADSYKLYFNTKSTNEQPITHYWMPYYLCQTTTMTSSEYKGCLIEVTKGH